LIEFIFFCTHQTRKEAQMSTQTKNVNMTDAEIDSELEKNDKEMREKLSQEIAKELEIKLRKEIEEKLRKEMSALSLQNAVDASQAATEKLANIMEVRKFEVTIVRKMPDGRRDRCPNLNRNMTQCSNPVTPFCKGVCLKCYNKDLKKDDKAIASEQKKINSIKDKQNEAKRKAQDDVEQAEDAYRNLKRSRKLLDGNTTTLKDRVKRRKELLEQGIESDDEASDADVDS